MHVRCTFDITILLFYKSVKLPLQVPSGRKGGVGPPHWRTPCTPQTDHPRSAEPPQGQSPGPEQLWDPAGDRLALTKTLLSALYTPSASGKNVKCDHCRNGLVAGVMVCLLMQCRFGGPTTTKGSRWNVQQHQRQESRDVCSTAVRQLQHSADTSLPGSG